MTKIISTAEFDAFIATGVSLLDLYADWCGPCQSLAPVIEDLSHEFEGRAHVAKLNIDDSPEIAEKFGVMSIPTILVFKDGELVEKVVGLQDKSQYVTLLNKHL